MTPRQRFRAERQRRQNYVFTITIASMAVLLVLALAVFNGLLPVPFGNSFNAKVRYAEVGDIPCPPTQAQPLSPEGIKVQVLNTTTRAGIAGEATTMLTQAGFTPEKPSNSSPIYSGRARIKTNATTLTQAYTVARLFPGAHVVLAEATNNVVLVELGQYYEGALTGDTLKSHINDTAVMTGPEHCLPLDDESRKLQEEADSTHAPQSSNHNSDQQQAIVPQENQSGAIGEEPQTEIPQSE